LKRVEEEVEVDTRTSHRDSTASAEGIVEKEVLAVAPMDSTVAAAAVAWTGTAKEGKTELEEDRTSEVDMASS
jgi:hypothetical protein